MTWAVKGKQVTWTDSKIMHGKSRVESTGHLLPRQVEALQTVCAYTMGACVTQGQAQLYHKLESIPGCYGREIWMFKRHLVCKCLSKLTRTCCEFILWFPSNSDGVIVVSQPSSCVQLDVLPAKYVWRQEKDITWLTSHYRPMRSIKRCDGIERREVEGFLRHGET